MKRTVAAVFVLILLILSVWSVGCGKKSQESETSEKAMSLLMESSQAMSQLSSYRMRGNMVMDAEGAGAAQAGLPMNIEFQGEVQIVEGQMLQHMSMNTSSPTISEYKTEAYMMGDQYYQYLPDQGWVRMNLGTYKFQNLNMGMMDAQQIKLMTEMAQNARIFEEGEEKIGVSFQLDENFFRAALEMGKQYMQQSGQSLPEEWLATAEEFMSGAEADARMWFWRDSKLVDLMDMEYTLGGMPPLEHIQSTMSFNFYDYNQDIRVVLPEEAKGAKEYTIPSV